VVCKVHRYVEEEFTRLMEQHAFTALVRLLLAKRCRPHVQLTMSAY
jgi:hypothetical protein